MKKKPLLILLLILVLCLTMFMTACGGSSDDSKADPGEAAETSEAAVEEETSESEEPAAPGTLEEYFNENEDTLASMRGYDESSGIEISCKGNDFIYLYDFSKMEDSNLTEEDMKNEVVVDSLKESLEDGGYTFGNVAQSLEKLTGISGINVVVTYTWGDEVIFSKSFTSADME